MSSDPFTQILNEILQGLVTQLNGEIGSAIRGAGYDPYPNVASGSASIGVGTASYSISNLTGISSLQIQDMVVGNVTASGANLSGTVNFHAVLNSSLSAQASGSVKVLFFDPGISGNVRIDNPSISGTAQFQAGTSGGKLCLNQLSGMNASFNYGNASVWIDGLGPLNYLLQPVENLILDAAKGAISGLISSQINSIVGQELNQALPQCVPFP
ncbi:hypothetical protein [Acidovorax sp. NCPPB 3576]|uniref:hypothetical protein n=1 Tax=Acidovorax sp. NCPPB 3576 TaxID=2940488 RepID=UPI00234BB1E0|nr:hypothetical protein [Acidovorax sp. NCPPB 3576]WCM89086.1 hypothetical protein M5C98_03295 [Acidovorax sp. NCPPB 3576]